MENQKSKTQNSKKETIYDLEERTFSFAKDVRLLCRSLTLKFFNIDDVKQLIRSSGSVAANYIEAQESISKKDFYHRIKICRKEARESNLWIRLIKGNQDNSELDTLEKESMELSKIFGSIVKKYKLN